MCYSSLFVFETNVQKVYDLARNLFPKEKAFVSSFRRTYVPGEFSRVDIQQDENDELFRKPNLQKFSLQNSLNVIDFKHNRAVNVDVQYF